ncbi:MAG: hypothetical protein IJB32_01935 [Clostridia bacterium]|nr:hypothetical protein [Clostridia bacterium]
MDNNLDNRLNKGKRQKIVVAIGLALLVVVSFLGGYFLNYIINGKKINKVTSVLRIMESVGFIMDENGEPREITEEELADALVNAVLDDYSAYYTAEEYEETKQRGKGNLTGVGLTFYDADCIVDKIVGNSPADNSGIMAGDELLSGEINGKTEQFDKYLDMITFLENVPSEVDLKINAKRNGEKLEFSLKKVKYVASYVTYYDNEVKFCFKTENNDKLTAKSYNGLGKTELNSDTAYISFDSFEGDADKELIQALEFMKERGRTKLILDLRGNGGGYMDVLTEVAGCLIHCNGKNNFIVAVAESKNNKERFYSGKNRFNTEIKSIAVLADKRSASASECLIGAMIHYGGAFSRDKLIIEKAGDQKATTYGKGIMQTTYGLIGGGALKLTTARILWPDEQTCIHGKGIETKAENQVAKEKVLSRALQVL